jgi:Fe-S-cluster containining protein
VADGAKSFPFACQGCGAYCCTNERLVLSPLEVRSLVRALGLGVSELSDRGWLAAFPDPESGVPRVAVEFLPVKPGLTACPFLGLETALEPVPRPPDGDGKLAALEARQLAAREALAAAGDDGGRTLALRCQAYHGRPIMCRSFPLQFKLDLRADGTAAGWSMLAHTRCPGHDRGDPRQTVRRYVEESGVSPLAEARVAWHRLNLAIAASGVTLADHDTASGSRRALWDATLNLLFASSDRPRLDVSDDAYVPTIYELFRRHLAPAAGVADVEERASAGAVPRAEAAAQLRALVAACQALETALDGAP